MKASKKKSLSVDVGVIASLGRDSIKDHTTAILELVKNSYDAGAKVVDIEIMSHLRDPYIRVADDGHGMTEKDIDNYWLRIGFSQKRIEKYHGKRRKTGEKGVGRLSADRLGAKLKMRTLTPGNKPIEIDINWNKFNRMGKNIQDVKFDFFDRDVKISLPKKNDEDPEPKSGTELIIRDLRQDWVKTDFDELYKQLSLLLSPFGDETDFDIRLRTGQSNKHEKVGISEISNYFEVKLEANFNPQSKKTTYTLWERVPGTSERVKKPKETITLKQLITSPEYQLPLDKITIGPVKVVIFYYPRSENILLGSNFTRSQLTAYMKENAGIKLYRDNIRVKPYGEPNQPGGDWLNLGARFAQNPAGRKRPDHRIRPAQLVGAIFISRDENQNLSDSSSREGLIQDDHFRLLFEYVRGCIRLVEASSHETFIKELELQGDQSTGIDFDTINKNLGEVRDDLQEVSKTLSKYEDEEIRTIGETVATLVEKISYATEGVGVLESQTRLYRGLATIGIASVVFGHETPMQISRMSLALKAAKGYLLKKTPNITEAINKIEEAITASDQVSAWGGFALDRVRRDKRDVYKGNIGGVITRTIKDLQTAFEAIGIEIDDSEIDTKIESTFYKIDIESVILNLMTNAYTACRQVDQNRKVKIVLKREVVNKQDGYSLIVSDSGPGVHEKLRSIIWEPTFTTKTVEKGAAEEGTGMGLAIINGIVEEMNGLRKVDTDATLGGARFEIWLPVIL